MFIAELLITIKKWKQSNVHQLMMDKQNVAYLYNGILLDHKKKAKS